MNRRGFICGCCAATLFRAKFGYGEDFKPLFKVPSSISAEQHFANLQSALRAEALQARDAIRDKADSATASQIDSVRFRFSSKPINNARAFIDPSSQEMTIEIFVGLSAVIEQISLARSFSTVKTYSDAASDYIIYLGNEVKMIREDPSRLFTAPRLKEWFDFINMTDIQEAVEFYQTYPEVRKLFDLQSVCSVAFVVGHELGHHLLGHSRLPAPTSPAESRAREEAADDIALSLVARTPYPAVGAISAFISFYLMDPEGSTSFQSTHPDPRRRILKIARRSFQDMLNDSGFVASLKQSKKYESFISQNDAELAAFAKLIDELPH